VIGAPTFHQVFESLAPLLEGRIVVTHGSFDRVAITRACEKHRLPMVNARWLDNQTVVRRTWPQFARKGYSLGNLARHFDIAFQHHDALEDAIATAQVFKRALTESGRTAQEWLASIEAQSGLRARILQAGLVDGPFAGKTVVFTGRLRIARQEAARLAAMRGFDVGSAVTPATTLLCVGQEKEGFGKSAKEREAERLAAGGHPIAIVAEEEFWRMVRA
jgi:DNA polymerase-3 subunit epsilon